MNFVDGKPYYVEFLDHCVGMKTAMKICVVGWVVDQTKDAIHFTAWNVMTEDSEVKDGNLESFTVLKAVIKKKRVIKGVPDRNFA